MSITEPSKMSNNALQKVPNKKAEAAANISQLQQDIINNTQKDFPLCARPYQAIANMLATQTGEDLNEAEIFNAMADLDTLEILSRIGPVFDHKKAGASTLAALAAPEQDLDRIADIVNQFDEVNHNYGRESHSQTEKYNLWFVVTASDMVALKNTITDIELQTGLTVLVLPMEASYHIDLAFSINLTGQESPIIEKAEQLSLSEIKASNEQIDDSNKLTPTEQNQLRKAIEKGLPLVLKPYQAVADLLNFTETQVLNQIALWQTEGLIRRFGLVVKHRKLGYNANAMVVWNVDNEALDGIALSLAKCAPVSLCYQRPRRLPDWPYNLFCMIHGTDRTLVLQQIDDITEQLQLKHIEKDILFSFKAYKQHGARYLQKQKTLTTIPTKTAITKKQGANHA